MKISSSKLNTEDSLPLAARNLLARKLKHLKRESEGQWQSERLEIYRQLTTEMALSVQSCRFDQAFITVPINCYKSIVSQFTLVTKNWPCLVWQAIEPILDQIQFNPEHGSVIFEIIDEYSWSLKPCEPLTLNYINQSNFEALVFREAGSFGGMDEAKRNRFVHQLNLVGAAAKAGVMNAGRQAREGINIKAEEYFLSRGCIDSNVLNEVIELSLDESDSKNNSDILVEAKEELEIGSREWRSQNAKKAINARHDQPGGSREKQESIRKIWATGKYTSRERCAEEECAAMNISFTSARKALRNTPDPLRTT
jgi:hypothetical protein